MADTILICKMQRWKSLFQKLRVERVKRLKGPCQKGKSVFLRDTKLVIVLTVNVRISWLLALFVHFATCWFFETLLDEWQTVYALIRRRILRRLIWVYTVCLGLSFRILRINMELWTMGYLNPYLNSPKICIRHFGYMIRSLKCSDMARSVEPLGTAR